MPAKSEAQRRLFAVALHSPEKLRSENKSLASLSKETLHDFAATSGKLPYREHKEKSKPRRKRKNYGE